MFGKDYFYLAFGSMIGIGWLVSVPFWIDLAGSVGAIIAVLLTTAIAIPIGFAYGELTASLSVSGGEFAYTLKTWGRLPGFICGWFLCLMYIMILPWVAIAVAVLISYLFPQLDAFPLYTILDYPIYLPHLLISLLMVFLIVYMNMKGVKYTKIFQNVVTILMITIFVVFIVSGWLFGSVENTHPLFSPKGEVNGILLGIASILFFMNGFDTIPKMMEEANQKIKRSRLGWAIVGTILAGALLYILIILASSMMMSPGQMDKLGDLPLAAAFQKATGSSVLSGIVIFGALAGVVTTFNGFLMAGSRLISSFSTAGFLHPAFGTQHPEYRTPHVALWVMAVFSMFGILLGRGVLLPFIILGGVSLLIAWFSVSLSVIRLRMTHPEMVRPYKMPGGIYMGYLAFVLSGSFLIMMLIPGTPVSLGKVEYSLFLAWVVFGGMIYFFQSKKRLFSPEKKSDEGMS
ncbi:APC family permease [Melghirimyces profundicolus]|nr:APC family permease [Melghirimyces profundicolus]